MTEKTAAWSEEELASMRRIGRAAFIPYVYVAPKDMSGESLEEHECPVDEHCDACVELAWREGGVWAIALVAMAEAIRAR